MTAGDTIDNMGTVFSIAPDGSDYTILHHFEVKAPTQEAAGDGQWPHGSLLLKSGTLYGLTWAGGCFWNLCDNADNTGCGTLFSQKPDGSDYTLKRAPASRFPIRFFPISCQYSVLSMGTNSLSGSSAKTETSYFFLIQASNSSACSQRVNSIILTFLDFFNNECTVNLHGQIFCTGDFPMELPSKLCLPCS
jgi:hypothetical protein